MILRNDDKKLADLNDNYLSFVRHTNRKELIMSSVLILVGLAILFMGLAFAGLALKSFFRKDATLHTCSGGGDCGCHSVDSCHTVEEKPIT